MKAAGDHRVVQEKRGRKVFSRGVWAPAATIDRVRAELEAERSTEGYAKRKDGATRRRASAQSEYVEDFRGVVLKFLAFHPVYADLAGRLAHAVTDHATPVGSGTVARTKRIPVEPRAEAAVIAWMRHQTTGYEPGWRSHGSGASGGKSAGGWRSDRNSSWSGIGAANRPGTNAPYGKC